MFSSPKLSDGSGTCQPFLSTYVYKGASSNVEVKNGGVIPPLPRMQVAGSSPNEVDFFNLPNPSGRTMALGSTQPPTEMNLCFIEEHTKIT
jgi:hypothetical protein